MPYWRTEELVSKQSWYQNGYRANVVADTVAKFSHLIQFEGSDDLFGFRSCWSRQGLTLEVEQQLATIAYEVFEVIVAPEVAFRTSQNGQEKNLL